MTALARLRDLGDFLLGVGIALAGAAVLLSVAQGVLAQSTRQTTIPAIVFGSFWPYAVAFFLLGLGLLLFGIGLAGVAYHRPVAPDGGPS